MSNAITASLEQLVSANLCQNFEPGISWCRHFVPSALFSIKVPFVRVHIIISTWRGVHFLYSASSFLMKEELLLSFTLVPSAPFDKEFFLSCTTSILFDERRTVVVFTHVPSVPFDKHRVISFVYNVSSVSWMKNCNCFLHMYYQFLLMKSPSFLIQRLSFLHNVNSFWWMKNCCCLFTCTISSFWWRVLLFVYNVNSFWWLENCSCFLHMYHQFLLIKIPCFLVQR